MAVGNDSAVPSHDCSIRDQLLWAALHSGSCAVILSGPVKFATAWVARCPRLSQSNAACKRAVADGTGGVRFTSAALEGSEMEWLQNKPRGVCL